MVVGYRNESAAANRFGVDTNQPSEPTRENHPPRAQEGHREEADDEPRGRRPPRCMVHGTGAALPLVFSPSMRMPPTNGDGSWRFIQRSRSRMVSSSRQPCSTTSPSRPAMFGISSERGSRSSIRSRRAIGFGSAGPPTASVRGAGVPIVCRCGAAGCRRRRCPFAGQPLAHRRAGGYLR
jgi:hypothetical protein